MVRSDETVHTNKECKTPKATKILQNLDSTAGRKIPLLTKKDQLTE